MSFLERIVEIQRAGGRAVLFTVVAGGEVGAKQLVLEDGSAEGDAPAGLASLAPDLIRRGRSKTVEHEGATVFAEVYAPPPRLLVYGAVDTAEALCRAAKLLGWRTIVADQRPLFLTRERIPSADELIAGWPEEVLAQVKPDHATAILTLTHDVKFDVPLLAGALASEAFYIGALGSRRFQQKRRENLVEAGVSEEALARISGPCGLDLGAESQAETAVSILAEALALRAGREGGRLQTSASRIHAEP